MPRYIDADKIKQELLAKDAEIGKPKDWEKALKSAGIFLALVHIQLAEAEDVAPVVHAHKVRVHSQGGGTHWVVCSHCEKPIDWQDVYCKHCGAIMDEEVD